MATGGTHQDLDIAGGAGGPDTNFAITDLTLTGARTHDLNSSYVQFQNGSVGVGTSGTLSARFHVIGENDLGSSLSVLATNNSGDTILRVKNDGYITHWANTANIADGDLNNNEFSFSVSAGALSGKHKDNLGVVHPITFAGGDVFAIYNSSGVPTFYSTPNAAIADASAGDTIQMLGNYTETTATQVNLKDGVNINGNNHTYKLTAAGTDDAFSDNNIAITCKILDLIVERTTGTGHALHIDNGSSKIDANGSTFKMSGANHTVVCEGEIRNCEAENTGGAGFIAFAGRLADVHYGTFINCVTTNSSVGFANFGNVINCFAATTGKSYSQVAAPADVLVMNCKGVSTGDDAFSLGGTNTKIIGGEFITSGGIGLDASSGSSVTIVGGLYSSTSSAAMLLTNITATVNAAAFSTSGTTYAIGLSTGANIRISGCDISASGDYAFTSNTAGTVDVFNNTIVCTENNAGGHAFRSSNASGTISVVRNTLSVINASANCIHSTVADNIKFANNVYIGASTPVNANVTQDVAEENNHDNKGNILI